MLQVDWQGEALRLLDQLHRIAATMQQVVLQRDVVALPELVRREAELASRLSRTLEQGLPAASPERDGHSPTLPEHLRRKAQAWWALHQQNRMLLQHAHQTVVALIELLAGAAQEPMGLYSVGRGRWSAGSETAGRPLATAVDQRA